MSSVRGTLLWMAVLSVGTLGLGALRELVIAGQLQASESADLFYRGIVVISAARMFNLALLRARWVPLGTSASVDLSWRAGLGTSTLVSLVGLVGLAVILPPASWFSPIGIALAAAVATATIGAATRAAAERRGHERIGVVTDWCFVLGTIAGTLLLGGAFGAIVGLSVGSVASLLLVAPAAYAGPREPTRQARAMPSPSPSLYVDTLVYVNLGLLDSIVSIYAFDAGQFALLNYGYFFVNAVLAVPTAGVTIVALRAGASAGGAALRRWALLAGLASAVLVAALGAVLGWPWVAALLDGAVGWPVTEQIVPIVLVSVPFAGLRLANTVGRQARVAADPSGLMPWDLSGLAIRAMLLWFGAQWVGPLASPVALGVAELIQLGAWVKWRPSAR